jgi:3-oxoacyl-[acyl-carrier protein] reductase
VEALNSMADLRIEIGTSAEISHLVTEHEINEYAKLSGDDNLLHTSPEFAAQVSRNGVVSHGVLTMSLISRIIGTRLPGNGALWISQMTQFTGSVHVGDRLTGRVEVTKAHVKDQLIDVETTVINQNNEIVLRGTGRVKLPATFVEPDLRLSSIIQMYPILILGGSSAVGLAITEHLASKGFDVTSTFSSHPDELEKLVTNANLAGQSARAVHLDLRSKSKFLKKIAEYASSGVKPLGLVNCLATEPSNEFALTIDPDDFGRKVVFESEAIMTGTKLLLDEMRKQQFGRIINIGSSARNASPEPGWLSYIASKQAAFSIIRSLAVELGPFGVTANSVAPGLLGIGMTNGISERIVNSAKVRTPTGRLPSLASVCSTVEYLLSPNASDINGQEIVIDGGRF